MKCLWYQNVKYGIAYEKLSHNVDDLLHPSESFTIFMDYLRKKYRITVVNSRVRTLKLISKQMKVVLFVGFLTILNKW